MQWSASIWKSLTSLLLVVGTAWWTQEPVAVAIKFAPRPSTTLSRRISITRDLSFSSVAIDLNGRRVNADIPVEIESKRREDAYVITDTLDAVQDGMPVRLWRTFDELRALEVIEYSQPAPYPDQTIHLKSDLSSRRVLFAWNPEEKRMEASFGDRDSAPPPDNAMLEELEEDLDWRSVLPSMEVRPGAEWRVDFKGQDLLVPGGNLRLTDDGFDHLEQDLLRQLRCNSETHIQARYDGTVASEGGSIAVVDLRVDTSTFMLWVPSDQVLDSTMQQRVERRANLHGQMRWNVDRGHLDAVELHGKITEITIVESNRQKEGGSSQQTQTTEYAGELGLEITIIEE